LFSLYVNYHDCHDKIQALPTIILANWRSYHNLAKILS
jgi:hypothetical protein